MSVQHVAIKYTFLAAYLIEGANDIEDTTKTGLIEKETGILHKDGIYFYSPSAFAVEHLFYPTWGAEYVCDAPYRVNRTEHDLFDAFILFYIQKGSLRFSYRDQQFLAQAGDVVLLDCKHPNQYWAEEEVRFDWVHFSGNASQAYADLFYEQQQVCFSGHSDIGASFHNVLHHIRNQKNDAHYLSAQLHCILAQLACRRTKPIVHPAVQMGKEYLESHFSEPISLAILSKVVNLSPYHFSRLFRSQTGIPIHAYLLSLRMGHAKTLLSETYKSVEEVGQLCGFSSTSHFIRAFKGAMRLTPARFRNLF